MITSNIPGCAESVVDGESGLLFEVKNAEDLYSKMEQMISMDRDSLARMGLAGRKHMEDVFDTLEKIGDLKVNYDEIQRDDPDYAGGANHLSLNQFLHYQARIH